MSATDFFTTASFEGDEHSVRREEAILRIVYKSSAFTKETL